ncbi:hypothetical protein D3C72_1436700 [compost metagenome]
MTRVSCTFLLSQYCGFLASTTLLLTCHSFSTKAPLLTILPGLTQSLPNLSMAAFGTGPSWPLDTTSGRKATGYGVLISRVNLSSALTPTSLTGFLPSAASTPLSRKVP